VGGDVHPGGPDGRSEGGHGACGRWHGRTPVRGGRPPGSGERYGSWWRRGTWRKRWPLSTNRTASAGLWLRGARDVILGRIRLPATRGPEDEPARTQTWEDPGPHVGRFGSPRAQVMPWWRNLHPATTMESPVDIERSPGSPSASPPTRRRPPFLS